jgi:AcrR family transcriptional regulator
VTLRERKKQQARRQILAAATALVDQQGYRHTTMREIAASAEVSHQTLYNYFPNKVRIVHALLLADIAEVRRETDRLIDDYAKDAPRGFQETLLEIIRIPFSTLEREDRELWRVVWIDVVDRQADASLQLALFDPHGLARLFTAARQRGELTGDADVTTLGEIMFVLGQHAVGRYLLDASLPVGELIAGLRRQGQVLLRGHVRAAVGAARSTRRG